MCGQGEVGESEMGTDDECDDTAAVLKYSLSTVLYYHPRTGNWFK